MGIHSERIAQFYEKVYERFPNRRPGYVAPPPAEKVQMNNKPAVDASQFEKINLNVASTLAAYLESTGQLRPFENSSGKGYSEIYKGGLRVVFEEHPEDPNLIDNVADKDVRFDGRPGGVSIKMRVDENNNYIDYWNDKGYGNIGSMYHELGLSTFDRYFFNASTDFIYDAAKRYAEIEDYQDFKYGIIYDINHAYHHFKWQCQQLKA